MEPDGSGLESLFAFDCAFVFSVLLPELLSFAFLFADLSSQSLQLAVQFIGLRFLLQLRYDSRRFLLYYHPAACYVDLCFCLLRLLANTDAGLRASMHLFHGEICLIKRGVYNQVFRQRLCNHG